MKTAVCILCEKEVNEELIDNFGICNSCYKKVKEKIYAYKGDKARMRKYKLETLKIHTWYHLVVLKELLKLLNEKGINNEKIKLAVQTISLEMGKG